MKGQGFVGVMLVLALLVVQGGTVSTSSVATADGRSLAHSPAERAGAIGGGCMDSGPEVYVTCTPGTDISDEIQAAVDTLRELGGGTIYLPEGDFLFSTPVGTRPQYMMPGGINVIGQGIGKTILRHTVHLSSFFDINHWGYADGAFKISGISFYGVPAEVGRTSGGITIHNIVDFRIDHCYFERILYNINVNSREGYPQSRGVVDHCSFIAADLGSVYGVTDSRVWEADMKLGTAEATFIEDCYIEGLGHPGASFGGGHYVLRHSTIVDSASIDAHGPGFDSSGRGARATEIYENYIYHNPDSHGWTAVGLRAGGGVIFNNTFERYDHAVRFSIDTPGYNATGGTYPTLDQIHDTWIWENTLIDIVYDPDAPGYEDDLSDPDRSIVSGVLLYSNNAGILIQKDRDFHMRAPSQEQDCFTYAPYTYPHPLTNDLALRGAPGNQTIQLDWTACTTYTWPATTTWQITYEWPPGYPPSPVTDIISPTRAYSLTVLTNYKWYTVTLNAMAGPTPFLTDTVRVMPTDLFWYLPIVRREY